VRSNSSGALYPVCNIAELAGVRVYYIKLSQMLAKIMACIQSKTGDLSLAILGRFIVSFN
jgi:hypothetical protein